jgi:biopolymer transport protein ExbD
MAHIKKPRIPIRIDMTPMVDVAFLLLTFFMLTTQFKPPEEVDIILPVSHSEIKLPESNVMTLLIDKSGNIFLGFDSAYMMESIFGQEARLKTAVEVTTENLPDLLMKARISNPKLRTVIKGDADADYGTVSDVMDILQKTQITRFAMVTNFNNKT